ncbi:trigger factor [Candidatus Saccharibacteria bacterium RIFCSPHIGHO2_02_FULL_47_12]|nr:MAG: trigger factor [Candidatus Saccharibacteria bacterium RIFCSPHIGHO2_02_FULL_47_12]
MQIKRTDKSPTEVVLNVTADQKFLDAAKNYVLRSLSGEVKVAGFRPGKAPLAVIEKNIDASRLQTEFLEQAINSLYGELVRAENLRPVKDPAVSIKKFVPFDQLEAEFEVETIGAVKLADYKSIKKAKPSVSVTAKEVNDVLASLRKQAAERSEVQRPSKNGDEVTLDFKGVDAKGQAVNGAEGKDYPLVLGSNTFIPGFEPNVVGIKAGEEKEFAVTFPKDYNVAALQGKKVTFKVKAHKVSELKEPELNDDFVAKVSPFKKLDELKVDIKKQLTAEKQREADQIYQNETLEEIASKSSVALPKSVVDNQIERGEVEERQNLAYRGTTWEEHLKEEGVTAEEHRERNRSKAENTVKISVLLTEIAEKEGIEVTPEELEIRLQILKGQYPDAAMQAELDKPENKQDIYSRLMTEKTIAKLVGYASGKKN